MTACPEPSPGMVHDGTMAPPCMVSGSGTIPALASVRSLTVAVPLCTSPPSCSLTALIDSGAFGAGPSDIVSARGQRWVRDLSPALRLKCGRAWQVSPAAVLPTGQSAGSLLTAGPANGRLAGFILPPGSERWSEKDRQRFLDTHELLRRVDALSSSEILTLKSSGLAAWAAERGLACDLRSIQRYRARVTPGHRLFDGNVDRRGHRPEPAADLCSPDAWGAFLDLYLQTNQLPISEAHRLVAAEAPARGWSWPALRTIQQRVIRRVPRPAAVLARQGDRRFRADCLPKIAREYTMPAGEHWCGDERTFDFWCRVPDARKGWRAIRPKLTAWSDMRSRRIVGWSIGQRANSDTILASFKSGALIWGLPSEITMDCGEDYKSVGGRRSRKWDDIDSQRLGTVFQQCSITPHYAVPYTPWAKPIESLFSTMKDSFDRHQVAFCGGSPDERPADMADRLKNILNLPTLDEVRTLFATWLDSYHATPHRGNGTDGLCPSLVMEQHRGTVRTCTPEVLDFLVARLVGPISVRRDGIHYRGIIYGQTAHEVLAFQGKPVWLRVDPERADAVWVCDERGVPQWFATNDRLRGATQEDLRKAAEHRARLKRTVKEYLAGRLDLLDTKTQAIMDVRRRTAQAAQVAARTSLPQPEPSPLSIVRPDLHDAAARAKKREQAAIAKISIRGASQVPDPCDDDFDWAAHYQPDHRPAIQADDDMAEIVALLIERRASERKAVAAG